MQTVNTKKGKRMHESQKQMNARFWVMTVNAEFASVTLRPGQTLRHFTGGPNDEGFSYSEMTLAYDGELVTMTEENSSRDCDGRYASGSEMVCHVSRLASQPNEWSGLMMPDWETEASYRRDYSAEAAGY